MKALQKDKKVLIAVGAVFCIVLGTIVFYKLHNLGAVSSHKEPQSIEKSLLGAWKIEKTVDSKTQNIHNDITPYEIAFVVTSAGSFKKEYYFKGDSSTPIDYLDSVERYVVSAGTPAKLRTFDYYDTAMKDSSLDEYTVVSVTGDELVLKPASDDVNLFFKRVRSAEEENSKTVTLTDAEKEIACKSLLNRGEDFGAPVPLPISCPAVVSQAVGPVAVNFDHDLITVTQGDKTLFTKKEEDLLQDNSGPLISDTLFSINEDINYDGNNDIVILSPGAYNTGEEWYVYNPKTGMYDSTPILSGVDFNFDPTTKTASTYEKGRGIGDIYTIEDYTLRNTMYVLTDRETQDLVDEAGDTSKGYTLTREKLKDGKMVVVSKKHLSEEEVLGTQ